MDDPKDILKELNKVLGEEIDIETLGEVLTTIKSKMNKDNQEKLDKIITQVVSSQKTMENTQEIISAAMADIVELIKQSKVKIPTELDVNVKNHPKEVRISNLKEIIVPEPLREVKIGNFPDYSGDLGALIKLMSRLVIKADSSKAMPVDLDRYTDPRRPLAVELSDGRKFYTAIGQAVSSAIGVMTLFDLQTTKVFANIAAGTTDSVLVAAVSGKRVRVISAIMQAGDTETTFVFNSKGGGAGTAISMIFQNASNGGEVLPANENGWFDTATGEGLTATTGAGSTTGVQLNYILV
jgi:hypothetical protein